MVRDRFVIMANYGQFKISNKRFRIETHKLILTSPDPQFNELHLLLFKFMFNGKIWNKSFGFYDIRNFKILENYGDDDDK